MTELAARIKETLARADITPRVLAEISNVHYTTIYLIIKNGGENSYASIVKLIEDALSGIERLLELGMLPVPCEMGSNQKTDYVKDKIAKHLHTNTQ